ncbi:MAG TPA: FGGY-family carbohydrate kinase [Candidatus Limnocylindrales bacterium]|nr:FGGY-family carbohydrate kinase [Candidatus Limnocylindrales bacterium]
MSAAEHVLAIDVGTQSVRALVFDPAGVLVAHERIPIVPYVSPQPGWAEHDPGVYWAAIGAACAALWARGVARREAIAGVALTTQRSTVVVTDEDGSPLRPAIVWLDQRRAEGVAAIGGVTGLAFRALGVRRTVAAFQAECEAAWLRANEPSVYARIRHYLFLSGFLTQRLTGRFVDSVASQVGYVPFDYKRQAWAKSGDWRWQAAPVDPSWLPELVPPGGRLGELTAAAAVTVGLPAGTPVVAAAADKACEVIGSGALEPWLGSLSYGTTATINTTQRRYVESVPLVPPYPAAIPGAYALEVQVYRGYWLVDWFKRQFGAAEVAQADALGIAAEALFDDLVRATEPGAMGLLLQPTWTPGVRVPGPEAKGAMIGFGDVHTRAHLYRAILEGLAYALREGGERAAGRAKVALRELRVSGGGAQSPAAVQLTADIFGLPAGRPHTHETSGLGAAIDAAVGLGLHPSFEAAIGAMTRVAETIDPDPDRHALYDRLYQRVYRRMYERLKPLYEEIMVITGYPPS